MNKNRNKTNVSITEIMIVADRSGSMACTIAEARNSINRLIEDQKKVKGEAFMTFAMFDDVYERNQERASIQDIKPIGSEYSARGMTALLDAVGRSINYLDDCIKKLTNKPDNVIFVIITDGHENASHEFTKATISQLVKEKKTEGWEFKFIGANIDAFSEGSKLGFAKNDTVQYNATDMGTKAMYINLNTLITQSRTGE